MNLEAYDKSLIDKLSQVFTNSQYASPDEVFSKAKDDESGSIILPMISAYRIATKLSTESGQLSHPGRVRGRLNPKERLAQQYLHLDVTYQVDIWSVDRSSCDAIFVELLFYLLDQPNICTPIPQLNGEEVGLVITDTDNEMEFMDFKEKGRIYRNMITLEATVPVFRTVEYTPIETIEVSINSLKKSGDDEL